MAKATGPAYNVPFKRRRKGLTNYKKRLALVKSGKPRMIVRKTHKRIIVQFADFAEAGDKIIASADSKELSKFKWVNTTNLPTAYLTGLLAGLKAKKNGVEGFVLDMGLKKSSKNSFAFAAEKGALDSGLKAKMAPGLLDDSRVKGEHIAKYAEMLKTSGEYEKRFSDYLKQGVSPEKIPELFEAVKQSIIKNFSGGSA